MPMHVTIEISQADFTVYATAAGYLKKVMRDEAPSVLQLLAHEFTRRAPDGIILDYTESIGFDTQELHMMLYRDIWKQGYDMPPEPDFVEVRERLRLHLPKQKK